MAESRVASDSTTASELTGRSVLGIQGLTPAEINHLLELARRVKAKRDDYRQALAGKTLAMLFEKPSLRTRATFEIGINELGGSALYLAPQETGLDKRESVKDVARNLSRWVHVIMARVFAHQTVLGLAEHASVPVINGLSDLEPWPGWVTATTFATPSSRAPPGLACACAWLRPRVMSRTRPW
jgi:ornithine carbamoyltransferase